MICADILILTFPCIISSFVAGSAFALPMALINCGVALGLTQDTNEFRRAVQRGRNWVRTAQGIISREVRAREENGRGNMRE